MDFLGLKIIVIAVLAWVGYVAFRVGKAKLSGNTAEDTFAEASLAVFDDAVAEVKTYTTKLEHIVADQTAELAKKAAERAHLDEIIAQTQAKINEVSAVAEKLKAVL